MPIPSGFTMHDSGYWFRQSDMSGPYVFDGITMFLVSALITGAVAPAIVAASNQAANNTAVASLAAAPGKITYVTGFTITGAGSTLGSVNVATLSGLAGPDLKYTVVAPAGVGVAITPVNVHFDPPIPAASANAAITLTVPAAGAGNVMVNAAIYGYQL